MMILWVGIPADGGSGWQEIRRLRDSNDEGHHDDDSEDDIMDRVSSMSIGNEMARTMKMKVKDEGAP